jgi:hypothetical protein
MIKRLNRPAEEEVIKQYFQFYGFYRLDSTVQEIPRPAKDRMRRKIYHSGKKKKHKVKNLHKVNELRLNLQIKTYEGRWVGRR